MDILEKVLPVKSPTKPGPSVNFYWIFICFSFLLPLILVVYELYIQSMTSDMVLPDIFWQLGGNLTVGIFIWVCVALFIFDRKYFNLSKKAFAEGRLKYRVIPTALLALSYFNLIMFIYAWFLSLGFHGYYYF